MTVSEPVAELVAVTRRFGNADTRVVALDTVSCRVTRGERISVVGPSGSGKSTLLSVLGLIDRVDEGEVIFEGRSAEGLSEDQRADLRRENVGFVFQMFHLVPALSAMENVMLPLAPYASSHDLAPKAQALLVRLGLGDRVKHRPAELSGGEQQRVAIARALVGSPNLVLADEPTGNLDSKTSGRVLGLLLQMQREQGFALVVATHNQRIASHLDRTIALLDGRVVAGRRKRDDLPT